MPAPKARNIIARGKREAQRNASPLVTTKDFEWSTESAKYQRQLFRSFRACRSLRALTRGDAPHGVRGLPPGFIFRAFRASKASYSASSALLGFQIARPSALPGFHIARLWRSAPKNILAILQPRVLYTVVHVSSKHKQTIQKFRAAQKFWTVRLRRQQTSRGVRI